MTMNHSSWSVFMTKNTSRGAKKHCECIKPEGAKQQNCYFSSSPDGLVQNYATLY